jgi:hypothetical protein
MVAGTALQVNAQKRRQTAMENAAEDAQNAEVLRQQSLSKEREEALNPALNNATRASQEAALAEAAAKREAAYEGDTTLPGDEGTADYQAPAESTMGQPKVVQEETAKQRAKADADVRSIGNARARLQSYGDVGLGNQILNQDASSKINMLGGFSRMSSSLLPGEVQAAMASKAGKGRNQELLGTALQMYGSFGAPGMGAAAAGAAGAGATGATAAGYSGNLSGFTPGVTGAALSQAAPVATAQPGMLGGLFGGAMPWWQQQQGAQGAAGIGSLLANRR